MATFDEKTKAAIKEEWQRGAHMEYSLSEYEAMYAQDHPDAVQDGPKKNTNVLPLNRGRVEQLGAAVTDEGLVAFAKKSPQLEGADYLPADGNTLGFMNEAIRMNILKDQFKEYKAIGTENSVKCVTQFNGNPFNFSKHLNEANELNADLGENLRASSAPQSLCYGEYVVNFLEDAAKRSNPECDPGLTRFGGGVPLGDVNIFERKFKENPEATMSELESTVGVVAQAYKNNIALAKSPMVERMTKALDEAAGKSEMFAQLKNSVEHKHLDCRQTPLQPSNDSSYGDLHACAVSAGAESLQVIGYLDQMGVQRPTVEVVRDGIGTKVVENQRITERNADAAAGISSAYQKNKPSKSLTPATVRADEAAKNPTRGALGTDRARQQQYQTAMYGNQSRPDYGDSLRDQNQHSPQQLATASNMHSNTAEAMRAKYGSQAGNNKNSAIIQQVMQNAERVQGGPSGPSNNFQPGA